MNVQVKPEIPLNTGKPSELRDYIAMIERDHPKEILRIADEIDPAKFEATAILANLEEKGINPMVLFERPINQLGKVSPFPLITNIYSSRRRDALALGLKANQDRIDLSLEYSRREARRVPPVRIASADAPVKQVVKVGDQVDLRELPIVRHHRMDPAPYIDMAPIMRDPEMGHYNIAFLRMMYKGPRKLGIHMSPRHNWQMCRKNELKNRRPRPPSSSAIIRRSIFGSLNVAPFGTDDYAVLGGMPNSDPAGRVAKPGATNFWFPPTRTWYRRRNPRPACTKSKRPFGEFPGTTGRSGCARSSRHRDHPPSQDAIFQHIFVGHATTGDGRHPQGRIALQRHQGRGADGQGGALCPFRSRPLQLLHLHRQESPTARASRPRSSAFGDRRLHQERRRRRRRHRSLQRAGRHVRGRDAHASRESVDIIKNVKGNTLDPSQTDDIMTDKMIIDATKPMRRPWATRLDVPAEVRARFPIEKYFK